MEPLVLGNIDLEGLQAPEEVVFGIARMVAVNDHPGGIRTVQTFGSLPLETIYVKGLFLGEEAEERILSLRQLQKSQAEIELAWSQFKYRGVVKEVRANVRHKYRIHYELEYIPLVDLSAGGGNATFVDPDEFVELGFVKANDIINGEATSFAFDTSVRDNFNGIQDSLNTFVRQYNGKIYRVPRTIRLNLSNQVSNLGKSLVVLKGSSNSGVASANALAISALNVISRFLIADTAQFYLLRIQNPNLFQLARSFYDDVEAWRFIAEANGLLDPMPIGLFTIKIPLNITLPVTKSPVFR